MCFAQVAVGWPPEWHKMLASWLGVIALAVAVVFASPTAAYAEPLFGGLFSRDGGATATLNKPDTPPTQELRVRMLVPTMVRADGGYRKVEMKMLCNYNTKLFCCKRHCASVTTVCSRCCFSFEALMLHTNSVEAQCLIFWWECMTRRAHNMCRSLTRVRWSSPRTRG
jgi:hypothetical protein